MEEIIKEAENWCSSRGINPENIYEKDLRQCIEDVTKSLNLDRMRVELLLRGYFG